VVGGNAAVCIVAVIVPVSQYLKVGLEYSRFFAELGFKQMHGPVDGGVEQPTQQSEGKHIFRAQDAFVVHFAVRQAVLHHAGDGCHDELDALEVEFFEGIVRGKARFGQVVGVEGVSVGDDDGSGFDAALIDFEGGGIHGNQHIGQVTRCVHFLRTDVYLVTGHTAQRTLWGTNFSGKIGES